MTIVHSDGGTPSWVKNSALASPMVTPGMNRGNSISSNTSRGMRSSRTAMEAHNARKGAIRPVSRATRTEVSIEPISTGFLPSSPYHSSVRPVSAGLRPVGLTEVSSGGSSGR